MRFFLRFFDGRHPRLLSEDDVTVFLNHLASDRGVGASTHNQALSAILFLYKRALERPLERMRLVAAKRPKRVPQALPREDVAAMLTDLRSDPQLVCMLIYGSGTRPGEALAVRVKDLEFATSRLVVRDGKGAKDRITLLPERLHDPLHKHLRRVRLQHERDLAEELGRVPMPDALARKYPNADREWGWQWVFPARRQFVDRRTKVRHRYHLHETVLQKAVRESALRLEITKHVRPHIFRHSFATHLIEDGLRHPHAPGATGPRRHPDDHALPQRPQPRRPRPPQPARRPPSTRRALTRRALTRPASRVSATAGHRRRHHRCWSGWEQRSGPGRGGRALTLVA